MTPRRPRLVIVGSGWAGSTLAAKLDLVKLDVCVVSPHATSTYTPLLASAACGQFDFRVAEEPIRQRNRPLQYVKANVLSVDFEVKRLLCQPAIEGIPFDDERESFHMEYDYLILTQGCKGATFGIQGVDEYAISVRTAEDARTLRRSLVNLLELASLPSRTLQQRKDLLHIAIIGGGPTGIEIAAEMSDLFDKDIASLYPHLKGLASITVHDVATEILSMFEKDLSRYATASFETRGVKIMTNSHITKVEKDAIYTKELGRIPCGLLIWATGNDAVPLTVSIKCQKSAGHVPRILTDKYLRVFSSLQDDSLVDGVYAMGDAADIVGQSLPTTAEVAVQKAAYLAIELNCIASQSSSPSRTQHKSPFVFKERRKVAYLGGLDGIWSNSKREIHGWEAWASWRITSLTWTTTWRRKILIVGNWALNLVFGKDLNAA